MAFQQKLPNKDAPANRQSRRTSRSSCPPTTPGEMSATEYKLTFGRLFDLLTGESVQDGRSKKYRFRNRVTLEPLPLRGINTFEGTKSYPSIGIPSRGSVRHQILLNARSVQSPAEACLMVARSYAGMWMFLQLARDDKGKGLIDPSDPEQREIHLLFPTYHDLMKLHVESMPDPMEIMSDFFDGEELARLVRLLNAIAGVESKEQSLYYRGGSMATQKESIRQMKRLIALYASDFDLEIEEVAAHMCEQNELIKMLDPDEKHKNLSVLETAIAGITKNEVLDIDRWAIAVPILAEELRDLGEKKFESIESFLSFIGWLED